MQNQGILDIKKNKPGSVLVTTAPGFLSIAGMVSGFAGPEKNGIEKYNNNK